MGPLPGGPLKGGRPPGKAPGGIWPGMGRGGMPKPGLGPKGGPPAARGCCTHRNERQGLQDLHGVALEGRMTAATSSHCTLCML